MNYDKRNARLLSSNLPIPIPKKKIEKIIVSKKIIFVDFFLILSWWRI
jgi:hypothetical protein